MFSRDSMRCDTIHFTSLLLLGACKAAIAACPPPVHWTIDDAPLIKPGFNGGLDAKRAGAPHVIAVGDRYWMYYWGSGADGYHRICAAESERNAPTGWQPRGSVLERQPDTDYNFKGPGFPFVFTRDDGPWLM